MTTTATHPAETSAGSSLEIGEPMSRAERRAAEKAAEQASTRPAKKAAKADRKAARKTARAARREALKKPNPYKVGDRASYTLPDGTNFAIGEITQVNGRDVYLRYANGVGFLLDHLNPGLRKAGLV